MSINVVRSFVCLFAIALLSVLISKGQAALILSDDFAYADTVALRNNWLGVTASLPDFDNTFFFADSASGGISANAAQRPATLTNQTLIGLNGRSAYRELGATVDKDFKLTAYVAMNSYSRTLQIGVGNNVGAGYSFTWNATNATQNSGNGLLNIREHATWGGAPTIGTVIPGNVTTQGNSPPTRYALPDPINGGDGRINYSPNDMFLGYSEINLTWDADTGFMQLFQDGVLKGTATDTDFSSFTRVYVGGGNKTFVDLITLEVIPEPACLSLIALSGLLLVARRTSVC